MPARIGSAFDTAVMSRMSARASTGCMASVTGLFQPSMTTATFSATISLARVTPTAGVLSSSLAIDHDLAAQHAALGVDHLGRDLDGWTTSWPWDRPGRDSGKIAPTLIGSPCASAEGARPASGATPRPRPL